MLVLGPERVHHHAAQRHAAGHHGRRVRHHVGAELEGVVRELVAARVFVEVAPVEVGKLVSDYPGYRGLVGFVEQGRREDQETFRTCRASTAAGAVELPVGP